MGTTIHFRLASPLGTSCLLMISFGRNWVDEVEDFLIPKETHLSTLITNLSLY